MGAPRVDVSCKKCNKRYSKSKYEISSWSGYCLKCSMVKKNTTHSESRTRLYRIWNGMKQRCGNVKNNSYEMYGGSGVKVCNEWLDYEVFRKWAISNGYIDTLSIDRKISAGNYEPNNCRWVNSNIQNQNKRKRKNTTNKYIGIEKRGNSFRASITLNREVVFRKTFKTENDAVKARNEYIAANGLSHTIQTYKDIK